MKKTWFQTLATSLALLFVFAAPRVYADFTVTDADIVVGIDDIGADICLDGTPYEVEPPTQTLYFRLSFGGADLLSTLNGEVSLSGTGKPTLILATANGSKRFTATFDSILPIMDDFGETKYYAYFAFTLPTDVNASGLTLQSRTVEMNGSSFVSTDPSDGSFRNNLMSLIPTVQTKGAGLSANMMTLVNTSPGEGTALDIALGMTSQIVISRTPGTATTINYDVSVSDPSKIAVSPSGSSMMTAAAQSITYTVTGCGTTAGTPASVIVRVPATGQELTIPINVTVEKGIGTILVDPAAMTIPEASSSAVTVSLPAAAVQETKLQITVPEAAADVVSVVPAEVVIPKGSLKGVVTVVGLDGKAGASNTSIAIVDPEGVYSEAALNVIVTNVPPRLNTPSAEGTAIKGVVNEEVFFSANAVDVCKTDTISYTWAGLGNNTYTGANISHIFTTPGEYEVTVVATDDDGDSVTGLFLVEIEESVTLLVKDESPIASLKGWGEAEITFNDGRPVWDEVKGNAFRPNGAVVVHAKPINESYPVGWMRANPEFAGIGTKDLTVVNPSLNVSVKAPEEGIETLYYISSKPYYPGVDAFGDLDQDLLSDTWENFFFKPPEGFTASSDNLTDLAFANTSLAGDFGATSNPDQDRLPTRMVVEIDNKIDGGKIRVFKYPLTTTDGYILGGKNGTQKFTNVIEYRGLEEDRDGSGNWIRYAAELVTDPQDPARGNMPGTDPTVEDTDGDGIPDGWEYYFWSTVKYEVTSGIWRAYDPTFRAYNESNFAYSGIPLLKAAPAEALPPPEEGGEEGEGGEAGEGGAAAPAVTVSLGISLNEKEHADAGVDPHFAPAAWSVGSADVKNLPVDPASLDITVDGDNSILYISTGSSDGVNFDICYVDDSTGFPVVKRAGYFDPGSGAARINCTKEMRAFFEYKLGMDMPGDISISWTVLPGLYDKQILLDAFDPMIATVVDADDLDNDGLTLYEEYILGTDPLRYDTDEDGMPDGWEVLYDLEPLDGRNNINGCGPGDNPDGDYMAYDEAGDGYIHAHALVKDYADNAGWNGKVSGYIPGKAYNGGTGFSNLKEFLVARYFIRIHALDDDKEFGYPAITHELWPEYTTNPLDNDTNQDGIPDGWALYVGYDSIKSSAMFYDVYAAAGIGFAGVMRTNLEDDPDQDDLDLFAEAENYSLSVPGSTSSNEVITAALVNWKGDLVYGTLNQIGNGDRKTNEEIGGEDSEDSSDPWASTGSTSTSSTNATEEVEGRFAIRRYFPWKEEMWKNKEWTNKKNPTCPFIADTDGDGIDDPYEFKEDPDLHFDPNGDGLLLVNYNPCSVDTNNDRLPDGFEILGGLYTADGSRPTLPAGKDEDPIDVYGSYGDPDGDGLPNYQEYLTASVYGWRFDKWYSRDNEALWMPNLNHSEYPGNASVCFRHYNVADFFRDKLSRKQLKEAKNFIENLEGRWGLQGALETYALNENAAYQQRAAFLYAKMLNAEVDVSLMTIDEMFQLEELAENEVFSKQDFSYGVVAAKWDPAVSDKYLKDTTHIYYKNEPNNYIVANYYGTAGFPSTMPRINDTDNDAMEDGWEVYHTMNPLYGGSPVIGGAGQFVDSDRADNHEYGDGSTDNWYMAPNPLVVRTLSETINGLMAVSREPTHFFDPLSGYLMEAAHYNLDTRPWLSGCRHADPDHDGLNNQEEAYNFRATDILHHTDPTPLWISDISNPYSHVSLYYAASDDLFNYWYWSGLKAPPEYIFSFEMNEGYDTDNDNIMDRDELTIGGERGITDPLNMDSPVSRKALYFNGDAAARTRNPYFHDQFSLTSYTVEFWFRAEEPVAGRTQTLIQRPVFMPIDDPSHANFWEIRNTFLVQLDPEGHVTARVDNDARETTTSAIVISQGRITPNVWTHVAVSMDSVKNIFTLYLNGEYAGSVKTALKPCTGFLFGSQYVTRELQTTTSSTNIQEMIDSVTNITTYAYSPAPIVLGVSDRNPWGIVSGEYDKTPWTEPSMVSNSQPELDEETFFKGWIDEVRIWDRGRSQVEITADMMKRYTKAEIYRTNLIRFAWERMNLDTATALSQFPTKILYHYSFDNLPDVVPSADRDSSLVFSPDTDPVPAGFDNVTPNDNPHPLINWWATAKDTSTVYPAYGMYIPWIENTVSHMAQYPPLDTKSIRPVYDQETWEVLHYRYATAVDWVLDFSTDTPVISDGMAPILLSQLQNSANPYGFSYFTGRDLMEAVTPQTFGGELDKYGHYSGVPIASDLLPLRNAVADIDVPLWDGNGEGWNNAALDSDGDGLPDWWEIEHGLDPSDPNGENGAYGDPDGDGLDNYGEYKAGTSPYNADSDSDGYSDYFSRRDNTSLTYGELYDDGDGMANDWEMAHGLNPDRYDATEDLDEDGWTNYEEFLAGTAPDDASEYPNPQMDVTFRYDGVNGAGYSLSVLSYAEKTAGTQMGGQFDSRYYTTSTPNTSAEKFSFGMNGKRIVQDQIYDVCYVPYTHILDATLVWNGFEYKLEQIDEELGVFGDSGIYLQYETGAILTTWISSTETFEITNVTVYKHTYPKTFTALTRSSQGSRGHLVSGLNRFAGYLDNNGNNEYDLGEPFGLAVGRPVRVGWDTVVLDIPLTDELFGYPRLSWPASTNANVKAYTVTLTVPGASAKTHTIKVEAPRTFLHEGDYLNAGYYGLNLGSSSNADVLYTVTATDGGDVETLAEGTVRQASGKNAERRKMATKYPASSTIVNGSTVEFSWEMDYRNSGVIFTLKNEDTGVVVPEFNAVKIPLPIRHGLVTDAGYYYTMTPQQMLGDTFVSLPSGNYSYTIKELINTTAVTPQSVSGSFQLDNSDASRSRYSISGTLRYFGKSMEVKELETIGSGNGTDLTLTGTAPLANPLIPGTVTILLKKDGNVFETLNDSAADGVLHSESATSAYSGQINYTTGEWTVNFVGTAPAADVSLVLATKAFTAPVYIQAFRVADAATSSASISGLPVAQTVQTVKGAWTVTGLEPGAYAIRAFLDSNKNGSCDDWETQGFALLSGATSPVLLSAADPLIITSGNLTGLRIILFDRDTDNDLLPDSWEYTMFGSVSSTSGYDQKTPGIYLWEEYADGALDADPRTPDTDLDGLPDSMEIQVTRTNTHSADTDGDGLSDLLEFLSGSNPNDASDAVSYVMPALQFDENDVPFVDCPYPALRQGIVLIYQLQRKETLADTGWENVCDLYVCADQAEVTYGTDGVTTYEAPAGTARMMPADRLSTEDWKTGFFRIKITADYGKVVENADGTTSFYTWLKGDNNSWSFGEAATGTGTLIRTADGTWSFVESAEDAASGTLIRTGSDWKFIK